MKVNFIKLVPEAEAPKKAHASDAGLDLTAVAVEEDLKHMVVTYHTGIAMEIPEGYAGFLFPRSSVYKHQLSLANCVGVIDSGYRGEILLKYRIVQPHISRYGVGDKVGQLIIMPVPDVEMHLVDTLDNTDRGEGGFGSTGV